MNSYFIAPDGNGDDTIWTGPVAHPIPVVRRCDLAWPAAFNDIAFALMSRPGRCGSASPGFRMGDTALPTIHCQLARGHGGWHRADDGSEWSA